MMGVMRKPKSHLPSTEPSTQQTTAAAAGAQPPNSGQTAKQRAALAKARAAKAAKLAQTGGNTPKNDPVQTLLSVARGTWTRGQIEQALIEARTSVAILDAMLREKLRASEGEPRQAEQLRTMSAGGGHIGV